MKYLYALCCPVCHNILTEYPDRYICLNDKCQQSYILKREVTKETCKWTYDSMHDYYETECENAFVFTDGRITDNRFIYCPYCGRKVKEVNE